MRIQKYILILLVFLLSYTFVNAQNLWLLDSVNVSTVPDVVFLEEFEEKYQYDRHMNLTELHHSRYSIYYTSLDGQSLVRTEWKDSRVDEKLTTYGPSGEIYEIAENKYDAYGQLSSTEVFKYNYENDELITNEVFLNDDLIRIRNYENGLVVDDTSLKDGIIQSSSEKSYYENGLLERSTYQNHLSIGFFVDSFFYDNQNRRILIHSRSDTYAGDGLSITRYSYSETSDSMIYFRYLDGILEDAYLDVHFRMNSDSIEQRYSLEFANFDNPIKTSVGIYSEVSFPHGKEYDRKGYRFDENQDSTLVTITTHQLLESDEAFYIMEKRKAVYNSDGDLTYVKTELKKYVNWDFLTFTSDPEAMELFPNPMEVGQPFMIFSEQLLDACYYLVNSSGQVLFSNYEPGSTYKQQLTAPNIPGQYYIIFMDNQGEIINTTSFIVH